MLSRRGMLPARMCNEERLGPGPAVTIEGTEVGCASKPGEDLVTVAVNRCRESHDERNDPLTTREEVAGEIGGEILKP